MMVVMGHGWEEVISTPKGKDKKSKSIEYKYSADMNCVDGLER